MAEALERQVLKYAPRPKRWQRWRGKVILAALMIAAAGSWYWGRPYFRQMRIVWQQRQWTQFQPPTDTVAFTNGEDEAKGLIKRGTYARVIIERSRGGTGRWNWGGITPAGY